jgi:hypothetical protein
VAEIASAGLLMLMALAPLQLELDQVEGPDKLVVRLEPPPKTYGECEGKQEGCTKACRYNNGIALGREKAGRRWPHERIPIASRTEAQRKRRTLPLWNPALAGCALGVSDSASGRDRKGNLDRVQVGNLLGITREAVRLHEKRALQKLKDAGQSDHLIEMLLGGGDL